jgi:hypothetical protein
MVADSFGVRHLSESGRTVSLPADVKKAVTSYLKIDDLRSQVMKRGRFRVSPEKHPSKTWYWEKPFSSPMVWHIARRSSEFTGIATSTSHVLRATAIAKALDLGLTNGRVEAMSGLNDPRIMAG